jgi:hypothetical protein
VPGALSSVAVSRMFVSSIARTGAATGQRPSSS